MKLTLILMALLGLAKPCFGTLLFDMQAFSTAHTFGSNGSAPYTYPTSPYGTLVLSTSGTATGISIRDVGGHKNGASTPGEGGGNGHIGIVTGTFTIKFTNTSTTTYVLDQLLFGAVQGGVAQANTLNVSVQGTTIQANYSRSSTGIPQTNSGTFGNAAVQVYPQQALDLGGLSLLSGESITFLFKTNNGNNGTRLDNISLVGELSAIPEPGSMVALGALLGGGCFLRTRRRVVAKA